MATELGVRYVLEGSVRKSGGRVRVAAQLINGECGRQLWAERYDRRLEDVFAVQDEITLAVVGAVTRRFVPQDNEPGVACNRASGLLE